jgi:Glycosyltransferase family 87
VTAEPASAVSAGKTSRLQRWLGIEDRLFTDWRLRFYARGIVVALAIAYLFSWARGIGQWVIEHDGKLGNIDFCWIWASGRFAATYDPSTIFDQAVYATAQNFYPPGECLFLHQYVYPPIFLFFSYLLGLMPYLMAFAVWIVVTFVLYEAAVYAIIPSSAALIAAAVSGAAIKNIQRGHNGFLTAGLIGLALVCVERRPWLSGIFLGLLSYKPQYGVLFPLVLLASRNWRALAGATSTTVVLAAAAALVFGYRTWPAFISSLFDRNANLSPDPQMQFTLETVYGALQWAGANTWVAGAAHLTVAGIVTAAIGVLWARPIAYSLKAAALCIGAVTVTPYMLPYDLCVLSIAAAFLVKDGLARGFLAGERTAIFACFGALFLLLPPVGPAICAVLLILIARRIMSCRGTLRGASVGSAQFGAVS